MAAQLNDKLAASRVGIVGGITAFDILKLMPITEKLGGQFLLDPNEINGWGVLGPIDNTNNQDLGNVGAQINRLAGGVTYPFDVRIKKFTAWHYVTNGAALPWGWALISQEKTDGSNAATNMAVVDEVGDNGGVGPNDYGDTTPHFTDIDIDFVHPANHTLFLGVAAPTAVGTNYWVRVLSGCIQMELA